MLVLHDAQLGVAVQLLHAAEGEHGAPVLQDAGVDGALEVHVAVHHEAVVAAVAQAEGAGEAAHQHVIAHGVQVLHGGVAADDLVGEDHAVLGEAGAHHLEVADHAAGLVAVAEAHVQHAAVLVLLDAGVGVAAVVDGVQEGVLVAAGVGAEVVEAVAHHVAQQVGAEGQGAFGALHLVGHAALLGGALSAAHQLELHAVQGAGDAALDLHGGHTRLGS